MTDSPDIKAAREWLDGWASIGGGVTITRSGALHPWRVGNPTDDYGRRCGKAEVAESMLCALLSRPELYQPIRVILATSARRMAAPGIAQIEKDKT